MNVRDLGEVFVFERAEISVEIRGGVWEEVRERDEEESRGPEETEREGTGTSENGASQGGNGDVEGGRCKRFGGVVD